MAVVQPSPAHAMARTLVAAIREEAGVRRLWVWSSRGYIEPNRDYVEFWLFADPADEEAERRLRLAGAGLHTVYPDANIRVHLITPKMLDGHDPRKAIRPEADEVVLIGE